MSRLTDRLRNYMPDGPDGSVHTEAAERIEALEERIEALEDVIRDLMPECGKCFSDSDSSRRFDRAKAMLQSSA